jgi:hypothetical protein
MVKFSRIHSFADATTLLMIIAAIALPGFWHIAASRFRSASSALTLVSSSAPSRKKLSDQDPGETLASPSRSARRCRQSRTSITHWRLLSVSMRSPSR